MAHPHQPHAGGPPVLTPAGVGDAFANRYYEVVKDRPALANRFYKDASNWSLTIIRPGGEAQRFAATGGNAIQLEVDRTLAGAHCVLQASEAQFSVPAKGPEGSVLPNCCVVLHVVGTIRLKMTEDLQQDLPYTQSFVLAPQEPAGFYVHNEMIIIRADRAGGAANKVPTANGHMAPGQPAPGAAQPQLKMAPAQARQPAAAMPPPVVPPQRATAPPQQPVPTGAAPPAAMAAAAPAAAAAATAALQHMPHQQAPQQPQQPAAAPQPAVPAAKAEPPRPSTPPAPAPQAAAPAQAAAASAPAEPAAPQQPAEPSAPLTYAERLKRSAAAKAASPGTSPGTAPAPKPAAPAAAPAAATPAAAAAAAAAPAAAAAAAPAAAPAAPAAPAGWGEESAAEGGASGPPMRGDGSAGGDRPRRFQGPDEAGVFLRGLAPDVTPEDVSSWASEYGQVANVNIVENRGFDTKSAYLDFVEVPSAQALLAKHGDQRVEIGGYKVSVLAKISRQQRIEQSQATMARLGQTVPPNLRGRGDGPGRGRGRGEGGRGIGGEGRGEGGFRRSGSGTFTGGRGPGSYDGGRGSGRGGTRGGRGGRGRGEGRGRGGEEAGTPAAQA